MRENGRELLAALGPLLDDVLDLDPDEREIRLAAIRLERPALARELETLLVEERRLDARRFLQSDAYLGLSGEGPSLAGLRIGAYTLEEPIGRGGMGSVWLARRSDGRFEGKAAVKLLNLAVLDSIGVERFAREGTVLAQLTHPNIARLMDAGVTDAGQPFLVLEHIEGLRIDLYCDEHRLGPAERLTLFHQVLEAVAHAHAHLVVHRDLKPSNILVTLDGHVKLLDFGIAKLLESEVAGAERTDLTGGGTPLTPEYAAPEQVLGGPVTAATDVYSLGVLLYLLLAGRHPTSGSSLTAAGHLSGILDTEPPRLSAAVAGPEAAVVRSSTPERLRRLFRGDLDNILAKALRKDSTQRYPTVRAFADDLERFVQHQPVQARPDSSGYRARKFVRRNRPQVLAGTLTACVLIGATVATTSQMVEARRQRDEARVQRDRARYEEQRATASSGFMETLLHTIAPARQSYTTTELLDRAREILETDYQADPRFVARMMIDLSEQYAALDNSTSEVALLARAGELANEAGDLETAARAQCGIALLHVRWGEVDSARTTIARAQDLITRARGPATWARTWCLLARAGLAGQTGSKGSALPLAWQALALARAAGDTASVEYADVLETVSVELHRASRVREALELSRQTIVVLNRIGGRNTIPMLAARQNEAGFLRDLGEMRSSDSALNEALPLARRMDPRYTPWYTSILIGELAIALGRPPDSAVASFRRALADARRTSHPLAQWFALMHLTAVLIDQGFTAEGQRRLAELSSVTQEEQRPFLKSLHALLAEVRGEPGLAHSMLMEVLAENGFPSAGVPRLHRTVYRAGLAALASGNAVAADSLARHTLRLQRELGQDSGRSGDIGSALLLLSRARLAQRDSAGAREALQRAQHPLTNGLGTHHPRTLEAQALLDTLGEEPRVVSAHD